MGLAVFALDGMFLLLLHQQPQIPDRSISIRPVANLGLDFRNGNDDVQTIGGVAEESTATILTPRVPDSHTILVTNLAFREAKVDTDQTEDLEAPHSTTFGLPQDVSTIEIGRHLVVASPLHERKRNLNCVFVWAITPKSEGVNVCCV